MEIQKFTTTTPSYNNLKTALETSDIGISDFLTSTTVQQLQYNQCLHQTIDELINRLASNIKALIINNPHDTTTINNITQQAQRLHQHRDLNYPLQPTLRQLSVTDKQTTTDHIILMLLWAASQLNINNNMSQDQFIHTAKTILQKHPTLRLQDIAFMLHHGITGDFGHLYDRLDIAVIGIWIRQYTKQIKEISKRYTAQREQHQQTIIKQLKANNKKIN